MESHRAAAVDVPGEEEVHRSPVHAVHDGPAVLADVRRDVALLHVPHLGAKLFDAAVVLGEETPQVRGEAFVQPDVRPVAAGEEVAEPLVSGLVGDETRLRRVAASSFVDEAGVGQRRRRDVLHPPVGEVVDARLRILRIGIAPTRDLGEEGEDLARLP